MSNESKNPPVAKFRDQGVTVSVWERTTDKGTFYSVTTECSYKSGEEWKKTDFVQDNQIQTLRKLLDLAHTDILFRQGKLPE
ncbi:hypothetical protein AWB68_07481 [Caballeronia choica]|uniref:Uncharacterized protein n=1 Tax=Caballeronia choica TaxID=326476 RepID=A0A158KW01_9BURK|nr:hypothetical protein [Caballeronia choica]SAL84893.1 hypothetical protein AWB68_07481 [Caballeronia choica]